MMSGYLDALKKELILRHEYLTHEEIDSIYLGGGTPSLLNIDQIASLLKDIGRRFQLKQDCEITVESNPDDLNALYVMHLKEYTPVNRLSIGIQSFFDDNLKLLNRRHKAAQSISCIEDAIRAGFINISIDLIYGIPGMTMDQWEKNLDYAFTDHISHVSAYHLSLEPGTKLNRMVKEGKIRITDEEMSYAQYMKLCQIAKKRYFQHYEISNFCSNDNFSVHNTNYWKQKKYLGLGPSAHSFDIKSRQWNISDTAKYIRAMNDEKPLFEHEMIDETKRYNEYIMLSMRTIWGINHNQILHEFGISAADRFLDEISEFVSSGHIIRNKEVYTLTENAWFISDHIISRLLKD